MHDQNERVCFEIIDEACNRLTEEGAMHGLDRELIYSIQGDWIRNLEIIQSVPVENKIDPSDFPENFFYSDEGSENSYSEEEYINKLEEDIGVYMVCFYTKVTKSKVKWKCNFKHGFINLDKVDIPYSSATGELIQW